MKKPGHALRLATAAVRGQLPDEAEWSAILEIANRGWLVPALYVAIRRVDRLHEIPAPVRDYLSFLHDRNSERNQRLRTQLLEAVAALNAASIEPILLKGAIHLFPGAAKDLGARMISDLDINITPEEMATARAALKKLGYSCLGSDRELGRAEDAGMIELHDRPSARSARYLAGDLRDCSSRVALDGAIARIPSATARALHLIVHDMIKEGDYWTFRIDLRHLHDLAELAQVGDGIDWQRLGALLSDPIARRALVLQARALEDLFDIVTPPELRAGRQAELRHVARLVCAGRGRLASVVRLIGNVARGVHHLAEGYEWRGGRRFRQQVYHRLASPGAGSRV